MTDFADWMAEYQDLQRGSEAITDDWVRLRRELAELLKEIEREAAANSVQIHNGEGETR
ncbi:hypothetical protein C8D88_106179 [Lentzea atacamensis]|uniref:Uncharacterized protein n=1 Tax=Lentzea atacamensis TaxID=531938 RepID=A0A316HZH4_9PSEU|nr:hypothetical protein [Lentzea atacamensis]PWK85551.1 hypothetical protein C8D88_106179 [Lentzea atacamensis]